MPAESTRLRRRIRPRDRWFIALAAGAALAAAPVAMLAGTSAAGPRPGCVSTLRAGFMGGATYTDCGAKARALCRARSARDATLAAECRRAGLLPPGGP